MTQLTCGTHTVFEWGRRHDDPAAGVVLAVRSKLFRDRNVSKIYTPPVEYQGRVGAVRFRRGDADFCVVVAYIPVEPHTQAQKQYNINIWQWIQHLLDQLPSIDVFPCCFWMPTVVSVQSLVHVWEKLNHKNKTTTVRCCMRVFNITTFLLLTHGIPVVLRTLGSLVTTVALITCVSLNPNNLVCKSVPYFIQQAIGYKLYLPEESETIVHYLFGFVIACHMKAQVFLYPGIAISWCQVYCKELIEMFFLCRVEQACADSSKWDPLLGGPPGPIWNQLNQIVLEEGAALYKRRKKHESQQA